MSGRFLPRNPLIEPGGNFKIPARFLLFFSHFRTCNRSQNGNNNVERWLFPSSRFLTSEGKKWIAAGSLGIGYQSNNQASSPYFPLAEDGRFYPSTTSSSAIGLISAQGAYLISPNWLIGGELGYSVTADYNEGSIGLYVRYFFEPRNGLLRTDLGLDRP